MEKSHATPRVKGLPVLGNTVPMYYQLPEFLTRCFTEYGPVFRVRALNNRYVVLAGPDGRCSSAQPRAASAWSPNRPGRR
ncbi:hypothetical protein [Mycolicibacterium lutetiense]|uniref:Cytochrome P450 n=1 Tax=Mycolicibacterium lutetiense TaxID=1641992 RepID=A0ABS5A3R5_9MYCO|nr:hypothetical protein [Mycolicibacterium lutetiense]MBP2456023.1 hypothetical protein [Mycolicibacterium lutetiense]